MADIRIVDDDIFLRALDGFFREGMKEIESGELLNCAESISEELSLEPSACPIEGYYHETPELSRYFRLMRALQSEESVRESEISDTRSFERLKQVSSSSIFGLSADDPKLLLPRRRDVLAYALLELVPEWKLHEVLDRARGLCLLSDCSLVGMACQFGSPYVVAALRETVALYGALVAGCAIVEEPEYRWEVSKELEFLAAKFIKTVSVDIGFEIPKASSENVTRYYFKGTNADIIGRCIALGKNDAVRPELYYHWAIRLVDGVYDVEEFWDEDLWTTERYSGDHSRVHFESVDMNRPLCKKAECNQHSVKLSLYCQKHHEEMLKRMTNR